MLFLHRARYCTDKYETTIWVLPVAVKIKVFKFVEKVVLYTVSQKNCATIIF